ncbi:MAG TPA: DsbA family protein [Acidimicrobiia bacterium]|nr:DsbA family protein [Acidimicrobiia bacterium]
MARQFAVTWDYRCPFARNAHEALVNGVREGRDWDVRFWPFSLDQIHVEEGDTPVWERGLDEERMGGVRALLWGIAVRDAFPDRFLDFHVAAFRARHDEGQKISEEPVLRQVAENVGLNADAVAEEVASGRPLKALETEHTEAADGYAVFGVPTVIEDGEAVFIRIMERGNVDDWARALDLVGNTGINEVKRTKIPR